LCATLASDIDALSAQAEAAEPEDFGPPRSLGAKRRRKSSTPAVPGWRPKPPPSARAYEARKAAYHAKRSRRGRPLAPSDDDPPPGRHSNRPGQRADAPFERA
jgi:hypothetical protein